MALTQQPDGTLTDERGAVVGGSPAIISAPETKTEATADVVEVETPKPRTRTR